MALRADTRFRTPPRVHSRWLTGRCVALAATLCAICASRYDRSHQADSQSLPTSCPGAGGGRAKPLVLCMRVGGSYCRLDAPPREGSTTHVRRFDPTCSLEAPSAICRCRVCLGRGGERPVVRPDPEDKGAAHRRRTRYLLGPRRGPDAGSTKSRWPEALGRQVGLFPHHRYHERSLGVRAQARGGLIRRLLGEGRYRNQEAATRVGRPCRRHRLPKRRIATPMSVS